MSPGADLEAKRAQGRTKDDLSKRRVPLRQSEALWCYQLTVIRTEARRYQVSAQSGKAAALLLPTDVLLGRTYLVSFSAKNTLQSATPSKHILIHWLQEPLWFFHEKPHQETSFSHHP